MSILTISEAKKLCARCDRCVLGKTRTNVVFGSGTGASGVMVVGEAPGANEDKEGKPFVGAAGAVLDNHLGYLRVLRNSLYITNTVKCRPPRNRQPSEDEVLACKPFLDTQIGRYKPKVIVLLGKTAAERFGIHGSMAKLHGRLYEVDGYDMPCFVTYHPASCIYKPSLSTTIAADFSALAENVDTVDDRFDEAMGAVISCMESIAETEAYTNLVKNSKLLRAGYFFTEPEFTAAVDVLMAMFTRGTGLSFVETAQVVIGLYSVSPSPVLGAVVNRIPDLGVLVKSSESESVMAYLNKHGFASDEGLMLACEKVGFI